jgi:bacterial/archaeal transporter family-2 protein
MTDTAPRPHSRLAVGVAVLVTILCGALVAAQSRVNSELSQDIGNGYLAAVISFGSGFVIVAIIAVLHRKTGRGVVTVIRSIRSGQTPWWYAAGGLAGGLFVLSQGLTATVLGVALFTVATVTGQTLSGLLVDKRGVGSMKPKPLTAFRMLGAALAVAAVAFSVSPQVQGGVQLWVLFLPLAAGLGLGLQQAVNGQIREISNSPLTATFFNFLVGATALAVVFLVHTLVAGGSLRLSGNPLLYVGGAMGIVFIAGYAITVRYTGVLLLGLAAVAGQLAASLVFDLVAPVGDHPVAWTTVVGTVATLVAVGIAAIPSRASTARQPR